MVLICCVLASSKELLIPDAIEWHMALPKGVPDLSRVIIVAVVTCFLVAVLLPNHIIPSLDGGIRNDINALRRRGLFVHKNADSRPEATSLSGSDR